MAYLAGIMLPTEVPEPVIRRTTLRPMRPGEARARGYRVSCVPEHVGEGYHFTLTIEPRGDDDRWAVTHHGLCLSVDGEWHVEPINSDRTPAWLAAHRFTLAEAKRAARKQAPRLTVNGYTVADVLMKAGIRTRPQLDREIAELTAEIKQRKRNGLTVEDQEADLANLRKERARLGS